MGISFGNVWNTPYEAVKIVSIITECIKPCRFWIVSWVTSAIIPIYGVDNRNAIHCNRSLYKKKVLFYFNPLTMNKKNLKNKSAQFLCISLKDRFISQRSWVNSLGFTLKRTQLEMDWWKIYNLHWEEEEKFAFIFKLGIKSAFGCWWFCRPVTWDKSVWSRVSPSLNFEPNVLLDC